MVKIIDEQKYTRVKELIQGDRSVSEIHEIISKEYPTDISNSTIKQLRESLNPSFKESFKEIELVFKKELGNPPSDNDWLNWCKNKTIIPKKYTKASWNKKIESMMETYDKDITIPYLLQKSFLFTPIEQYIQRKLFFDDGSCITTEIGKKSLPDIFIENGIFNIKKFYSSNEWAEMRIVIIKKYEGICQNPKCRKPNSCQVHHLNDPRYYPTLALSENNLTLLCDQCHKDWHSHF
jgi:hypothetical protein